MIGTSQTAPCLNVQGIRVRRCVLFKCIVMSRHALVDVGRRAGKRRTTGIHSKLELGDTHLCTVAHPHPYFQRPPFSCQFRHPGCFLRAREAHDALDRRSSKAPHEFRRTRCRPPEVVTPRERFQKSKKIGICRSRSWRCLENTHTSTSSSFFCASKSVVCRYLQKRLKKRKLQGCRI